MGQGALGHAVLFTGVRMRGNAPMGGGSLCWLFLCREKRNSSCICVLCFSLGSAGSLRRDHLVVHQASAAHAPDVLIVPSNLPCYKLSGCLSMLRLKLSWPKTELQTPIVCFTRCGLSLLGVRSPQPGYNSSEVCCPLSHHCSRRYLALPRSRARETCFQKGPNRRNTYPEQGRSPPSPSFPPRSKAQHC